MFIKTRKLLCDNCGKNALDNPEMFNILFIRQSAERVEKICVCCKGECNEAIVEANQGHHVGWQDLSNFTNPALYLQHVMTLIAGSKGVRIRNYSDDALEYFTEVLFNMSSFVFRELTLEEKEGFKFENLFNNY
jgi:hypothetical protein